MADINDLINAYVTARKRTYSGKTRGLASPEQQARWRQEAVEALDALKAEAWERGYMFAFAQERGDYTHSRPVPDYIAEDIRSWNPYITEETP